MNRNSILALAFLMQSVAPKAQDTIRLKNPSFESGKTGVDAVATDWMAFGVNSENFPDLFSGKNLAKTSARAGNNFVGLLTHRKNAWEGIGQALEKPLEKDSTYRFSLWMSHAPKYLARKTKKKKRIDYNAPTVLKILGYDAGIKKYELLAESPVIRHWEWQEYKFRLNPKNIRCEQIFLVALSPENAPENEGNLLIDNCSEIEKIPEEPGAFSPQMERLVTGKNKAPDVWTSTSNAEAIYLQNASFEAGERGWNTPKGWTYLGTCPTCKPVVAENDAQKKIESMGKNCLMLLAYSNGKTESIGQKLPFLLKKDSAYTFSIWLAKEKKHFENDANGNFISFKDPIVLRVWGYNDGTAEEEILAKTVAVDQEFWYNFRFLLTPTRHDYDSIALEAYFDLKKKRAYNGHVLLDSCSPIVKTSKKIASE